MTRTDALVELHTDALVETICEQVVLAAEGAKDLDAVGVALPGLVKNGVVEEAPNLPQLKGARIEELLTTQLRNHGINAPVTVLNDADGMAAGLASAHGKLDSMIRVWTLGIGIGYGRYPFAPACGRAATRSCRSTKGAILRLRRARAPGRHHGPSRDAAAFSGHGAGRGLRGGEERAMRAAWSSSGCGTGRWRRRRRPRSTWPGRARSFLPGSMCVSSICRC